MSNHQHQHQPAFFGKGERGISFVCSCGATSKNNVDWMAPNTPKNFGTDPSKPTTVKVWWQGRSVDACADTSGVVRVWDAVAGHFTVCHTLLPAQERYVKSRVRPS